MDSSTLKCSVEQICAMFQSNLCIGFDVVTHLVINLVRRCNNSECMCFHLLQELHSLQCMLYIWWTCQDQTYACMTGLACRCLYETLLFILTVDYELLMNECFHVLGVSLVSNTVQYVDITENRLLDRTSVTAQYDISAPPQTACLTVGYLSLDRRYGD